MPATVRVAVTREAEHVSDDAFCGGGCVPKGGVLR